MGCGGMKLAFSSPCCNNCASHSASLTSRFRPGSCLTCRAFTNRIVKRSSSRFQIGFQYTLVDSIARCVTRSSLSQSPNASRSRVIVLNRCVILSTCPSGRTMRQHTITNASCTSIPATRGCITSIGYLLHRSRRAGSQCHESVPRAPDGSGRQGEVPRTARVRLWNGVSRATDLRPLPAATAAQHIFIGCRCRLGDMRDCGLFSVDTTGMHRSRLAQVVVFIATLHPIAANQAVEAFRVSKSNVADVNQETLQEIN